MFISICMTAFAPSVRMSAMKRSGSSCGDRWWVAQ